MLNITYQDRQTKMLVREKTKVTDVTEQVGRRKWTWAGHVSRIRYNRWTLRITTWKPYDRKDLEEDRRDDAETNYLVEDSAR